LLEEETKMIEAHATGQELPDGYTISMFPERGSSQAVIKDSVPPQGNAVTCLWDEQMRALGDFIRSQRKLANLSLRQFAEMTSLSNPYLSQIERGLHEPSLRVLLLISEGLNVSVETLLTQAGLAGPARPEPAGGVAAMSAEVGILADEGLDDGQKTALIAVYHSMLRTR
jgi:transcriptional regulator with XRE-family HTH domain